MNDLSINSNIIAYTQDNQQPPQLPTIQAFTFIPQIVAVSPGTCYIPVMLTTSPEYPSPIPVENKQPEPPTPNRLPYPDKSDPSFRWRRPPAAILPNQPYPKAFSAYEKSIQAIIAANKSGKRLRQPNGPTPHRSECQKQTASESFPGLCQSKVFQQQQEPVNKRPPPPYQSRLPRAEDLIKQAGTSPSPSGKHPDQATTSLSSRGELIKQQIEESDPRFISKKMRHPDSFAASLLELCPGLHTTDLVLLTGVQYDTAALLRALRKVPLTEAGERLKQRLSSPDWNPYQPLAGEDSLKWAIRVSDMDYQLEPEDIVKIRPCCIKSLRKHQLRRPPLSANAQQVMEALNSAFPEKFARRQDEGWKEWFDRLAQHEPRLTHNELVTLTGFYPDVEHQYPFNIIQPPASRSPSAVQSATRVSKKALSPPSSTLHEAEYARSQAVSLAVQDQILRTKGLIRVANNSDTRTAYRNCLLIALLQHATKDYTQSPVLCQLVNNYRQWLVSQGWQGHASGFGPDGYMAFGHQGETTQGAAAALLEMINSNLMKGDLPPLRVINYSFAAGMEFEEILGSQAPDARVVHIVNTGQHFEALIAAPADNQT